MYRFAANLASKARVARNSNQQFVGSLGGSRNYAAKDIRFGVEARATMLQGVEYLAEAVKGPKDEKTLFNGLEVVERMKLDRGYISPHLITSQKNQKCIGGPSEAEVGVKKDRVTNALNATKAAVEEGIVPGGGVASLYASKLPTANFYQKMGVLGSGIPLSRDKIIHNALKTPVRTIVSNAGVESAGLQDGLRPLSPHLPLYKPQLNSTLSITHRISGVVLTSIVLLFDLLCLKIGLISFTYESVYQFFSISSKLVLNSVGIIAFFAFYHIWNGIRHLLTDFSGLGRKRSLFFRGRA